MATDVSAWMPAREVSLVQTVKGDFALWIDGQETGLRVNVTGEAIRRGPACTIGVVTLEIEAGQVEVRRG